MAQILYNQACKDKDLLNSIDEAIKRSIKNDNLDSCVFIVPTGKIVRYLRNEILFKYFEAKNKPLSELNIFTLQSFAKKCLNTLFSASDYILVSEAYRLALFQEAVKKANLQFFKGKDGEMSYSLLKKLSDVIMGLKEDGIGVAEIEKNLNMSKSDEKALKADLSRLEDIYSIYLAYNDILDNRFLDSSELMNLITQKLDDSSVDLSEVLPDAEIIIFEGFSEFKQPELKFIRNCSKKSIPLIVNIDYDDKEGPLYTILENSVLDLVKNGLNIKSLSYNSPGPSITAYLKHNLFSYSVNRDERFSNIIKIIEAPSRIEEVIIIARLVKHLILKENYHPSEISIAVRQPNLYSNLFREIFFTHKIPANVTERYELASSPVIVGIIAALSLVVNGFRRDDLVKFLKNPFMTLAGENDSEIDIDNIINLCIEFRISGGWKYGSIDGIIKTFEFNQRAYAQRVKSYEQDPLVDKWDKIHAKEILKNLSKAIPELKLITSRISLKEKELLPSEFAGFIKNNIIKGFRIEENIRKGLSIKELKIKDITSVEKNNIIEEVEKDAKALKALGGLLDEMAYILNDRHPNKKFTFKELTEQLKTAVSGNKYQVYEKIDYGVTVTTIEQTRQIPTKVTILCGAVDSEFPTQYKPETFLGMKLPDSEQRHILSERMQFYHLLTNGKEYIDSDEKRIYLSYPKFTEERELVRSPFIDALLKITSLENDACIIDYSIVKTAVLNNDFNSKAEELIKNYPWLYSVASDIDLLSEYGRLIGSETQEQSSAFHDMPNIIKSKQNIENYIRFTRSSEKDKIRIDKSSLPKSVIDRLAEIVDLPFSISSLENYASCPYKYFLHNVLRLEEEKEIELAITPMEIGNLLHKTVYEFYSNLANKLVEVNLDIRLDDKVEESIPPLIPVKLERGNHDDYLNDLLGIAEKLLMELSFEHPLFNIDKKSITGDGNKKGLIELWLDNELSRIDKGWGSTPILFEFGYGMKSLSKYYIPEVNISGLKIKGKIDRIELVNGTNKFLVADYKTTNNLKVSNKKVKDGKIFQIPIYIKSMQMIFKDIYGLDWEPACGLYYFFKTKVENDKIINFRKLLVVKNSEVSDFLPNERYDLKDRDEFEEILDDNLKAAKEIIRKIGDGIFDITPSSEACKYCTFSSICRKDYL